MSTETQNLGLVKAISSGTTAPTNTAMIWYDTNVFVHKYWNGAAWTILAGLSAILTGKKVWVDGDNGDDGTGVPYRIDLPFATIEAARDAASVGDLIEIYPATNPYTVTTSLLRDGINYWSWQGVNVTSNGIMFDGDTTLAGETITGRVGWYGYAVITDIDGDGRGILAVRTNPAFDMVIECNSLTISNISNGMVLRDGMTRLLVRGDYIVAGRPFRMQDTSNINAEVWGTISCTFGSNFNAVFYSAGLSWNGVANVKAKTFSMPSPTTGQSYIDLQTVVNGTLNLELESMVDSYAGSTQQWINGGVTTSCKVNINVGYFSFTNRKLFRVTASGNYFHFTTKYPSTLAGGEISAGEVHLNNMNITSTVGLKPQTNGRLYLNNCIVDTSVASVVPIIMFNGHLIMNNTKLVSDGLDRLISFPFFSITIDGYKYARVLLDGSILNGNLAGTAFPLIAALGIATEFIDDVKVRMRYTKGVLDYVTPGGAELSIYSNPSGAIIRVMDSQFMTAGNKVAGWSPINNNAYAAGFGGTYFQSLPQGEGLFVDTYDGVTDSSIGDGTVEIEVLYKEEPF